MGATTGERQIGKKLPDIAPNHLSRYLWAAHMLSKHLKGGSFFSNGLVLDAACGCAYGSNILAHAGYELISVDRADEAKNYSRYFVTDRVTFLQGDLVDILDIVPQEVNAAVSIETIEHMEDDKKWIDDLGRRTNLIIGTVPNQDVVPFNSEKHPFHFRHYTQDQVRNLFNGWELVDWHTQYGKWEKHQMIPGTDGMTLGFVAKKC